MPLKGKKADMYAKTELDKMLREIQEHLGSVIPHDGDFRYHLIELLNDPFKKEIMYTLSKQDFDRSMYWYEIYRALKSSAKQFDYIRLSQKIKELYDKGLLDTTPLSERSYFLSPLGRKCVKFLNKMESDIIEPISKEFRESKDFERFGVTPEDVSVALISKALEEK